MKTRKTTTVTRPKPATLLAALAAMALAGNIATEARTIRADSGASPITTISREEINQSGVTNVGELLNQTPGVVTDTYSNPYGNRYGSNNIDLRGLGNNRTLELVNGRRYIPNPNVYGQTGQFIPTDIETVEVLRGPQGTLYGQNNLGGTINLNTRLNEQTETFNPSGFTVGRKWDTNSLGTGLRYEPTGSTPGLSTDYTGLNTRLDTGNRYDTYDLNPTHTNPGLGLNTTPNNDTTTDTWTDTPTDTVTHNPSVDTTTDNTPTDKKNPCPESTTVAETGDATGVFQNQAPTNGWGDYSGYRGPCDQVKIDWDRVRNAMADQSRLDASNTAQNLINQSQPRPFFDFNYHNTATDELASRAFIGNQLANNPSVNACYAGPGYDFGPGGYPDPRKPYVGGNEAPKTYYRVGSDYPTFPINNDDTATDDGEVDGTSTTTTTSELPPVPTYHPTVRPINAGELNDALLGIEVEYGPKLIKHYLDKAREQRDDARNYTERAAQWRADAARAHANADNAREEAKKATRDSSREFWEQQARSYDDHARIMDDSANLMDRSAANANAAAESFEADAAQTATNFGQAVGEQANRTAQAAGEAARAQAAREAEAARVEAERQQRLNDLIRNSQQNSQSNTGNSSGNNAGGNGGSHGPDMREPQIGREPRNETLRKLLD